MSYLFLRKGKEGREEEERRGEERVKYEEKQCIYSIYMFTPAQIRTVHSTRGRFTSRTSLDAMKMGAVGTIMFSLLVVQDLSRPGLSLSDSATGRVIG